jgi:hypothetical protein
MEKENRKKDILKLNDMLTEQFTQYYRWCVNLKICVEHNIKFNDYSIELIKYELKLPDIDLSLIYNLEKIIEEYIFFEDDKETKISKLKFIENLIEKWIGIVTDFNSDRPPVYIKDVLAKNVWDNMSNSLSYFVELEARFENIEFENISTETINNYILQDIESLNRCLLKLREDLKLPLPESKKEKLNWKGQKNQLYSVLRQLKIDHELIGNSFNSIADFLIQNVIGFENTSKETIEKELKKKQILPKPKRIEIFPGDIE